jgi:hypothetical protein
VHRLVSGFALLLSLTLLPGTPANAAPDVAPAVERTGGLAVRHLAWGPLRVGMTAQQSWDTGMVSRERKACAEGYQMTEQFADRGSVWWREVDGKQRVSLILIRSEIDRTPKGFGVGTTLGELRQAFPKLTKVTSNAKLDGQRRSGKKDYWVASVRKRGSHINFQFPYGRKPTSGTKVEMVVLSRKQTIFPGC